jgi:hypothetical protein
VKVTGTLSSGSPFALVTVTLKGTENLVLTVADCGVEESEAVTVSGMTARLFRLKTADPAAPAAVAVT